MTRVLVADDEPAVLEVLGEVVEDLGHEVLKARDGQEALALIRTHRPALVIIDHMMPRLSGLEVCRLMAADATLRDIPVVLLSAAAPKGVEEARAFLAKPFELGDFERLVSELLGEAGAGCPVPPAPPADVVVWLASALDVAVEAARRSLREEGTASAEERLQRLDGRLEFVGRLSGLIASPPRAVMPLRMESRQLRELLERWAGEWREVGLGVALECEGECRAEVDEELLRLGLDELVVREALAAGAGLGLSASAQGEGVELRLRLGAGAGPAERLPVLEAIARLHGGELWRTTGKAGGWEGRLRLGRSR